MSMTTYELIVSGCVIVAVLLLGIICISLSSLKEDIHWLQSSLEDANESNEKQFKRANNQLLFMSGDLMQCLAEVLNNLANLQSLVCLGHIIDDWDKERWKQELVNITEAQNIDETDVPDEDIDTSEDEEHDIDDDEETNDEE